MSATVSDQEADSLPPAELAAALLEARFEAERWRNRWANMQHDPTLCRGLNPLPWEVKS